MKNIFVSNHIYVGASKISKAGRGVFAGRDIKKGEIIESSPMIEIPKYDMANPIENTLITYFFYYGKKKEKSAIALGFGSIYNHTNTPNAKYKINEINKVIDFVALKNIRKNDEITIDYYNGNPKKSPLWFEVK